MGRGDRFLVPFEKRDKEPVPASHSPRPPRPTNGDQNEESNS